MVPTGLIGGLILITLIIHTGFTDHITTRTFGNTSALREVGLKDQRRGNV